MDGFRTNDRSLWNTDVYIREGRCPIIMVSFSSGFENGMNLFSIGCIEIISIELCAF